MFCEANQLEMPDAFPAREFTDFLEAARNVLLSGGSDAAWREFAGATNLMGWRFRATADAWVEYKLSWTEHGPAAGFEELYLRQNALFRMFSAGVSCIDSTSYAIAALCSHTAILRLKFGPDEQRVCNLQKLTRWLSGHDRAMPLRSLVVELADSNEFTLWTELRNRMSHRSNLPRIVEGVIGGDAPPAKPLHFADTSSSRSIAGEFEEFDQLQAWLADSLRRLLVAGRKLAANE